MNHQTSPEGKPGSALQLFFILGGILLFSILSVGTAYLTFRGRSSESGPEESPSSASTVQKWRKSIVQALRGGDGSDAPIRPVQEPVEPPVGEEEQISELTGSFTRITPVPDVIGNIYFLGIYKNTGTGPIRKPRVDLMLLDQQGEERKRGFGYGAREFLLPGEETPVKILILKAPRYAKWRVEHKPRPPFSSDGLRRPDLKFSGVKMVAGRGGYYQVAGRIANKDRVTVSGLRIIAVLYDGKDNPAAVGSGSPRTTILKPGKATTFRYSLSPPVTTKPVRVICDYSARIK